MLTKANHDEDVTLTLLEIVREASCQESENLIDLIVRLGLLKSLKAALKMSANKILVEAAWALANIASNKSEYCANIWKLRIPEKLVCFLNNSTLQLQEQVPTCDLICA